MKPLFLLLALISHTVQASQYWIHPEILDAIEQVDTSLTSHAIVDGKRYPTGFRPTREMYERAHFREFPVWEADGEIPRELDFTKLAAPKIVRQAYNDCWAQGAALAFETVIGWRDRVSVSISRQSIIDCSGFGTAARGGYISVGFFETPNGGVLTDAYGYLGRDQRCRKDALKFKFIARDTGLVRGSRGGRFTVPDLQRAQMATGSLEVCGSAYALGGADKDGFILSNKSGRTNHCYALMGWRRGEDYGKPPGIYMGMGNSWGASHCSGGVCWVRMAKDDVNLDGSVVTEAAYIDYKSAVPPEPVQFVVENGQTTLTIRLQPAATNREAEVRAKMQIAISNLEG